MRSAPEFVDGGRPKHHFFLRAAENPGMRQLARIQPYIPRDLQQRLRAYSAAEGQTESAVVRAALAEYLARGDVDRDLIVRRLDALTQPAAKLQHDLDVLSQAFATFVQFSFLFAPPETADAQQRANSLYKRFMTVLSKRLSAGVRLGGEVRRAQPDVVPPRPGTRIPTKP